MSDSPKSALQALEECRRRIAADPNVAEAPAWRFLLDHDLPFEFFIKSAASGYSGEDPREIQSSFSIRGHPAQN